LGLKGDPVGSKTTFALPRRRHAYAMREAAELSDFFKRYLRSSEM
jgi:hypothetical protein